jgi:hypothetical protein
LAQGDFNNDGKPDLAASTMVYHFAFLVNGSPSPITVQQAHLDIDLPAVSFRFDREIDPATLDAADLVIRNLTTGAVSENAIAVTASPDRLTVTFRLPAHLADGHYRFELRARSVSGADGGALPDTPSLEGPDVYLLKGDINRDHVVDFADLLLVAQNYGLGGRTFTQGNVNYSADGIVDFDDLLMLAQRYGNAAQTALPISTRTRNLLPTETRGPR